MTIKSFYNSIIEHFSKSGFKNKEIRRELMLFVSIKALCGTKELTISEFEENRAVISSRSNDYFQNLMPYETSIIVEALNTHIVFNGEDDIFSLMSGLIDEISSIYNPKHGQHYTNPSMAKLTAEMLLQGISSEVFRQDTITVYEPSAGSGNLIFALIDALLLKGVSLSAIEVFANEFDDEAALVLDILLTLKGVAHTIRLGDTLENYFRDDEDNLMQFDFVIANPPFGVSFKPENLLVHKAYSQYEEKGKLVIAKASNSLPVFMEIIRKSFKHSAIIIGNDCAFDKVFKNGAYTNSVLGNIITDGELDTLLMQPSDMFVNTSINTNIMKLSNRKGGVVYIDTEKWLMYEKGIYTDKSMKNGYSDTHINEVLNYMSTSIPVHYSSNEVLDIDKLLSSFHEEHKETLAIIKEVSEHFGSFSLDALSVEMDILMFQLEHDTIFQAICKKHGIKEEEIVVTDTNAVSFGDAINDFIFELKNNYPHLIEKDILYLGRENVKKNTGTFNFMADHCQFGVETISQTQKRTSILQAVHNDIKAYKEKVSNVSLDFLGLDDVVNESSFNMFEFGEEVSQNEDKADYAENTTVKKETFSYEKEQLEVFENGSLF